MKLLLQSLAVGLALASAAIADTLVVEGQNDVAVDRPAIQAAIDAAAPRDTVELRGIFQLDGTSIFVETSHLSIVGQALDNDGDGKVNEDPADSVDNDGDGQTDEDDFDAQLVGVDDGFGGPALDVFPDRFNDGFELLGLAHQLREISFQYIKFSKINRGIYLFPDYDDEGTVLLCDSATPMSGSLSRITVSDNNFENGFRGVELLGRVRGLDIENNSFSEILSQAVVLFGLEIGCAEPDGSIVQFLPLGTPDQTQITDNRVTASNIGVISFISDRTTVRGNVVDLTNLGIVSLEDGNLSATDNSVDGAIVGVLGSPLFGTGPSSGNSLSGNLLTNNLWAAIVDCDTTGYRIADNEYAGSLISDVLLDGTSPGGECSDAGRGDSFRNTVIAAQFPAFVQDFGVDNRLLGSMIITAPEQAAASGRSRDQIRDLLAGSSRP
jgi:hypothetical protein